MSKSVKVKKLEEPKLPLDSKRIYILSLVLSILYSVLSPSIYFIVSEYYFPNTPLEYYLIINFFPWFIIILMTIFLRQFFKISSFDIDFTDISTLLFETFMILVIGSFLGYLVYLFIAYPLILITFANLFFNGIRIPPEYYNLFQFALNNIYYGFQIFVVVGFLILYYSKEDFLRNDKFEYTFSNGIIGLSFLAIILSVILDIINKFILLVLGEFYGIVSDVLYLLKLLIISYILFMLFQRINLTTSKKFFILNLRFGFLIITSLSLVGGLIGTIIFNEGYIANMINIVLSFSGAYYLTALVFLIYMLVNIFENY